jgi:hypothetical protein
MATKSNKKGPLGQDPSHMGNPMKAFREGGQKRMAAYKKGGYNTPTQNALPKKYMGGDDPMNPSGMTRPNISSPDMSNPFVKGSGLNNAMNNRPSVTPRPVSTTSVVPSPAPVTVDPVIPAPVPAAPVAAAPTLSLKEQRKLDNYNRSQKIKDQGAKDKIAKKEARTNRKVAKNEAIATGYKDGSIKPLTAAEKAKLLLSGAETVVSGLNAVNNLRNPAGGAGGAGGGNDPFEHKRGGSIKTKMKSGGAKPKAMYGMAMKPGMMKKGGTKKK